MQAYGASFAKVYNLRWTGFAAQISPKIRAYYEAAPIGRENQNLLDLCCGTGQLALHFLDHNYQVTGLDLSPAMLEHAQSNAAAYILAGLARFVQADAANFTLSERFGLVVSTFDALNHLPDFASLRGCFQSVYKALEENGLFIFDLNTLRGLQRWTGISVNDTPEMMLVTRSLFDAQQKRAFTYISGFLPTESGLWERFEETAYNTAFDLRTVRQALFDCGYARVGFVNERDFYKLLDDPEQETRVFIIAEK